MYSLLGISGDVSSEEGRGKHRSIYFQYQLLSFFHSEIVTLKIISRRSGRTEFVIIPQG
jgi:hypothetical protein